MEEPELQIIAETEMYSILTTKDEKGEKLYHLELGNATYHFFEEEWEEFLELVRQAMR